VRTKRRLISLNYSVTPGEEETSVDKFKLQLDAGEYETSFA